MDDGLDYQPTTEEVWPPAPILPPPEAVRLKPFMTTYYVLSRVLVSIGLAVFLSGTNYLQQWTTHRAHFVDWNKVCIPAGGMFLVFLGIGLGVPYLIRREEQKRVRKNAALEANAQNATD